MFPFDIIGFETSELIQHREHRERHPFSMFLCMCSKSSSYTENGSHSLCTPQSSGFLWYYWFWDLGAHYTQITQRTASVLYVSMYV